MLFANQSLRLQLTPTLWSRGREWKAKVTWSFIPRQCKHVGEEVGGAKNVNREVRRGGVSFLVCERGKDAQP